MHTFIYILKHIWHIRDSILSELSASDSASLLAVTDYDLNDPSIKQFLNPLRDILPNPDLIKLYEKNGYTVTLIGKDLNHLLQRIANPVVYHRFNPVVCVVNVFCIIAKLTPQTKYNEGCREILYKCPWASNSLLPGKWHELRSKTDDKINIIYDDYIKFRIDELEYGIGYNSVHRKGTYGGVMEHDSISMKLVREIKGGEFHTKYMKMQIHPYVVNSISSNTPVKRAPIDSLCTLITVSVIPNPKEIPDRHIALRLS